MRAFLVIAALALVGSSGCAAAAGSGETFPTVIEIDNNLPNITGVTAFLVTEAGSRRNLGPVNAGRTGSFQRDLRFGTYYLIVGRLGAEDIVSERFRIDAPNVTVFWNVAQNRLTFATR